MPFFRVYGKAIQTNPNSGPVSLTSGYREMKVRRLKGGLGSRTTGDRYLKVQLVRWEGWARVRG